MTSRKARCFRAIFVRNFLKIHTFFVKYFNLSVLSCDKKNLKWIFISYGIYETSCVFYIPSPKARGYKTHNSFHKYCMKWKFISDPIFLCSATMTPIITYNLLIASICDSDFATSRIFSLCSANMTPIVTYNLHIGSICVSDFVVSRIFFLCSATLTHYL